MLPVGNFYGALYHKLKTQSSAPEDGRNYRPKHVELIEIGNKLLLLHVVGCLYCCIRNARSHKCQNYTQVFLYSCASHAACSLLPLRWKMYTNRQNIITLVPWLQELTSQPEPWLDLFLLLNFSVSPYYVCGHKLFTALERLREHKAREASSYSFVCFKDRPKRAQ